jgi:predicted dehydrogenase
MSAEPMLRCAVVGMGWWGRHLARTIEASGMLELAATVDHDPAQAADRSSLEDVLSDRAVDAVVLCLPHSQHADAIERSAAAGKHVFCEKPLTLTAASARRAVDACRAAGVTLGVGHERRFEDPIRMALEAARDGRLGEILHAEAALSHDRFLTLPADHWRGSAGEAPAAGMTGMGVHLTDLLISILGPVAEVNARTARRVLPLPSGDVVSVQLRFEGGAIANVSAVSATPFYGRFALFGSHGWIEVRDDDHPEAAAGASVTTFLRDGEPKVRHVDAETNAVRANLEAFARAARGIEPYPFSDAELIHNVAVLEAIARSAASGQPVALTGDLAWDQPVATGAPDV